MAGVSAGCHAFHSGLVFEVVNAANVDIQFKIVAKKKTMKQDIKTWAMQPEEGCSVKLFWLMAGLINNVGYSKTLAKKREMGCGMKNEVKDVNSILNKWLWLSCNLFFV